MATTTADWIDELKSISVLELSERIKALEEEFGVSATAVAAAAPAAGGAGDGAPAEEEQSTVRRHHHRRRRQEDPGDQGRPRRHGPGPQGGQGARRRGAQARQGGHRARRGRQAQGRARGGRRERRGQVARGDNLTAVPKGALPGALRASGAPCRGRPRCACIPAASTASPRERRVAAVAARAAPHERRRATPGGERRLSERQARQHDTRRLGSANAPRPATSCRVRVGVPTNPTSVRPTTADAPGRPPAPRPPLTPFPR